MESSNLPSAMKVNDPRLEEWAQTMFEANEKGKFAIEDSDDDDSITEEDPPIVSDHKTNSETFASEDEDDSDSKNESETDDKKDECTEAGNQKYYL